MPMRGGKIKNAGRRPGGPDHLRVCQILADCVVLRMETRMGLVLSAKPGDAFFIGRRRIIVAAIKNPAQITIERDDGLIYAVGNHGWTQIFKGVFLCIGKRVNNG